MFIPFYIAVFFAPISFADWPSISTVWTDPFGLFLLLGLIAMLILHLLGEKIYIPKCKNFSVCFLFIAYHTIAVGILYFNLASYVFDTRLALQKYFVYIVFLSVMILIDVYIYNVLKRQTEGILLIAKILLISFILEMVYSIAQFMKIIGIPEMIEFVTNIGSYFGRGESGMQAYFLKLYGLTEEPSALANFIVFMLPWLLIIFYHVKKKHALKWSLIALIFLGLFVLIMTFSRTAYFAFILSVLIGCFIFKDELITSIKKEKNKLVIAMILLVVCANYLSNYIYNIWDAPINIEDMIDAVFSSFINSDERVSNSSNITRAAGMVAAINVFLDNPILGTGFGTLSLYQHEYYPSWAVNSIEVVEGMTIVTPESHLFREMPTTVIFRILAEGGIIAILIWTIMFMMIIIDCLKISKKVNKNQKIYIKCIAWMTIISQILAFNISYIFSYVYVLLFPIYWFIRDDFSKQLKNIEMMTYDK